MPTATIVYRGDLRTNATHNQSGTSIITDAPTDNHGKGEAFSPTDLVAAALGTCIITTMAIFGQREDLSFEGSEVMSTKVMSSDSPRRIVRIQVELAMKTNRPLTVEEVAKYERIAHTCPVARSLHPELEQMVSFRWL